MVAVNVGNVDVLFDRDALIAEIIVFARAVAAVPRRVFVERADVIGGDAVKRFLDPRASSL
jgi:hypothetical protein